MVFAVLHGHEPFYMTIQDSTVQIWIMWDSAKVFHDGLRVQHSAKLFYLKTFMVQSNNQVATPYAILKYIANIRYVWLMYSYIKAICLKLGFSGILNLAASQLLAIRL